MYEMEDEKYGDFYGDPDEIYTGFYHLATRMGRTKVLCSAGTINAGSLTAKIDLTGILEGIHRGLRITAGDIEIPTALEAGNYMFTIGWSFWLHPTDQT